MFGLYKKSYVNRDNLYIIFFGKNLKRINIIEMMDTIYYSGTEGKFFESSG